MKRILGSTAGIGLWLVLAAVLAGSLEASPGQLDREFGENGRLIQGGGPVTVDTYPNDLIGLDDGSTVSLETTTKSRRTGLVKRGPDGRPDPNFGTDGTALLPVVDGNVMQGNQVVIQGSWLVVTSSTMTSDERTLAIQRFDRESGELDESFGINGVAAFGPSDLITNDPPGELWPFGLTTDETGRIYVGASPSYWDAPDLLLRLTTDGELDSAFGKSGVVSVVVGNRQCMPFEKLTATPEGIYLYSHNCIRRYSQAGALDYQKKHENLSGNLTTILRSPAGQTFLATGNDGDMIRQIFKLDGSGNITPAFGVDGQLPEYAEAPDLAVKLIQFDSQGRFLLAGRPYERFEDEYEPEDVRQAFLRINPDGSPDTSFGDDGLVILDSPTGHRNEAYDLTTTPEGPILVGRSYFTGLTAIKLDNEGQIFEPFGDDGLLEFRASFPAEDEFLETLTVKGGGTLAGGRRGYRALLTMYGPNGKPDKDFGTDGVLTLPQARPGYTDRVRYLNRIGDDFIACIDGPAGVAVARITPEGTPDEDFGLGGISHLANLTECAGIYPVKDRILIAGLYGNHALAVIRLFSNGAWDQTYGDDGWAFLNTIDSVHLSTPTPYSPFAFLGLPDGTAFYSYRGLIGKIDRHGDPVRKFGGDGLALLPGGTRSTPMTYPIAIGLNRKGMIYVGGHDNRNPIIFKLTGTGKIVRKFGNRGTRRVKTPETKTRLTDLKVQSDGRVVLSAWNRKYLCMSQCGNVLAYRLRSDGRLDSSFARKGRFRARFGLTSVANSLSLSSLGITIGGVSQTASGGRETLLFRLDR